MLVWSCGGGKGRMVDMDRFNGQGRVVDWESFGHSRFSLVTIVC
jgi:hypothetical protein